MGKEQQVKPTKMVVSRKQSPPARCTRMVGENLAGDICGAPLVLFITTSPMPQYEQLVVMRCPEHIYRGDGVLPERAESPWRW